MATAYRGHNNRLMVGLNVELSLDLLQGTDERGAGVNVPENIVLGGTVTDGFLKDLAGAGKSLLLCTNALKRNALAALVKGKNGTEVKYLTHKSGCNVDIPQGVGMAGAGILMIGTRGTTYAQCRDSYYAFKKQLDLFVRWLRTGEEPVDFADTVEMMKIVIAGLVTRAAESYILTKLTHKESTP